MQTFPENKLNCFEMKILEINLFQEEEKNFHDFNILLSEKNE